MKTEIINLETNTRWSSNNFYFSYRNKNYIVDIGFFDFEKLSLLINERNITIDSILLTHGHYDHIAWLNKLLEFYPDIQIYIHEKEKIFLEKSEYNLSKHFWETYIIDEKFSKNIITFNDLDYIDWIKIIHTPGHTFWSSCFYIEEKSICFTWDTLFSNTYWRTDLITGNPEEMKKSLDRLFLLPSDTIVYPWHMESEKLGNISFMF